MIHIIIILMSLPLLWWQPATVYANTDDIVMYLEIGTLSEIILPEPYTTVQIPVQIVEMRDVPARNKTVITVHPIVAEKTKTNIRIYTQHYDFNIKLIINRPGARVTESLNLSNYAKKAIYVPPASGELLAGKNGGPTNGNSPARDLERDTYAKEAEFVKDLLRVNPNLLKPNKHAPAIIKNRVVFGVDYIFNYEDKLVFKATLWNKSKVLYNILHLTITYKEKNGIPLINQRETKSLALVPVYEKFSIKTVEPGQKSHILYVTSKLSPQDTGFFNCVLVEKNGTRNFDFDIPSYIKH